MTLLGNDNVHADAVRVVRIWKFFFYFHHNWLIGYLKNKQLFWMEKGSYINRRTGVYKALCKTYRKLINDGKSDYSCDAKEEPQ